MVQNPNQWCPYRQIGLQSAAHPRRMPRGSSSPQPSIRQPLNNPQTKLGTLTHLIHVRRYLLSLGGLRITKKKQAQNPTRGAIPLPLWQQGHHQEMEACQREAQQVLRRPTDAESEYKLHVTG